MTYHEPDQHDEYTLCYAWGHAWEPYEGSDWRPQFGDQHIVLRCMRCGSERRETYGVRTGDLIQRYYIHSPGYLWGKNSDKPTKGDFRLMAVHKVRENRREERDNIANITNVGKGKRK